MKTFKQFLAVFTATVLFAICTTTANVYVFGVVVDTSDNPVQGASIVISTTGPGSGDVLDTLTSGADGAFAQDVVYNDDLRRIRWRASKDGFNTENGMEDVVRDTADLDTIVLRGQSLRQLFVCGTIIDTSDNPINEAQIVLRSGSGGGGEIIDTLFSGTDGAFAELITITEIYGRIRYEVTKNGYLPTNGSGEVENDTCDLDTITLRDGITIINNPVLIAFDKKPDNIQLFNMRGQMIYAGRDLDLQKALKGKAARTQMYIAHFRQGKTLLYTGKVVLTN